MGPSRSLARVIDGGYCVGCGACAALEGSPIRMATSRLGTLQAVLPSSPIAARQADLAAEVCGFSGSAPDEEQLAMPLFGARCQPDPSLGYHLATYAGHVLEEGFRDAGSSGGMGSWLQCELLRLGLVDHVINVASRPPDSSDRRLFAYRIASSPAAVREGAKSKYYPIELSEVVATVRRQPGRYALVGLPCYIKAARLLCRQEPVLAERLLWFVGLVCGHLKSMRFAELMAWQMGIRPADLTAFDFRKKLPTRPANEYGMEATGLRNGVLSTASSVSRNLLGSDWGLGFFQYKACDFCDDVFAEVADIVVGDAWLPRFSRDPGGTNILVVRRPELDQIVQEAAKRGRLRIEPLAVDEVVQSQAAGLRHRRDGLRYRLHQARERSEWFPPKRVEPARDHLSRRERARYRLRERLRDLSHAAFAKALAADDLSAFASAIQPLVASYRRHRLPAAQRVLRRATYLLWAVGARLRSLLAILTGPPRER